MQSIFIIFNSHGNPERCIVPILQNQKLKFSEDNFELP